MTRAAADMRYYGDGREVNRAESVADKSGGVDMVQWRPRQWRYGKEDTAAAETWDGNKRDVGQRRWRFWASMMA